MTVKPGIYHKPTFDHIPEQKRAKIIDVAVSEFANNGFENANINVIARKAGVSVGSLYKYFDTKTDLFLTAVNFGVQNVERIVEAVAGSSEDVMVRLERLTRIAIDFSRRHSVLIKLYNEITSENNSELVIQLSSAMEAAAAKAYKAVIRDGQRTGEIRSDIDIGLAAFLVDTLIMGFQFSYACDYYIERFRLYSGDDILEKDDLVVESFLKFIRAALEPDKTKNGEKDL